MAGVAVPLLTLLIIAIFPWTILQGVLADWLSKRSGRPVFIGRLDRVDKIGFNPTIALRDIRIAQADWAGAGDFLRVREARVTFPVWPLLTGTFKPRDTQLSGLRLAMVRTKNGRENWSRPGEATGRRRNDRSEGADGARQQHQLSRRQTRPAS